MNMNLQWKTPSRGFAVAICGIVALLSLWNVGNLYEPAQDTPLTGDPYGVREQETRLQGVMALLPAGSVVGYLTEPGLDAFTGDKKLLAAQYAFAPRILVRQTLSPQRLVIGDFSGPINPATYASMYGLHVARDFGNGIVLFVRNGGQ
jgi:hypothetical protein